MSKASDKANEAMVARCELRLAVEKAVRPYGKPELHFITRKVAASGMSRVFSVVAVDATTGRLLRLDGLISAGMGYTLTDDGFRVNGTGMDMRFAVCDDIARRCIIAGVDTGNDIDYRSL